MTSLEITFVLFLTVFTIFATASLAYVVVVLPLKDDIEELREQLRRRNWEHAKANPHFANLAPPNQLPSIDDLPLSAWDITEYGDENVDNSTPEQVEEEMTELQSLTREADTSWKDLEALKHGKRAPTIYSG